jgi:hypothetical protein
VLFRFQQKSVQHKRVTTLAMLERSSACSTIILWGTEPSSQIVVRRIAEELTLVYIDVLVDGIEHCVLCALRLRLTHERRRETCGRECENTRHTRCTKGKKWQIAVRNDGAVSPCVKNEKHLKRTTAKSKNTNSISRNPVIRL